MNLPCDQRSLCPDPAEPVPNLSSEAPDSNIFFGYSSGPGSYNGSPSGPGNPVRPGGNLDSSCNTAVGVITCAASTQEEADLCAQRLAQLCGPGGNPQSPSDTPMFRSNAQTCTVNCPDGLPFVYNLAAGAFVANSQVLADRQAQSYACRKARLLRLCLPGLNPSIATVGSAYPGIAGSGIITVTQGPVSFVNAGYTWAITAGALPNGLTFTTGGVANNQFIISGTPTLAGTFSFTLRVTDFGGDFMVKNYSITVKQTILDSPMDQAVYHSALNKIYGVRGGYLFEFDSDGGYLRSTRFSVPCFSDASIAYNAADGQLYIAYWNEPRADTGGAVPSQPLRCIYQLNPATFAVAGSFLLTTGGPGSIQFDGIYAGPHRIIASGGVIYGTAYSSDTNFPTAGVPFWYKPASATSLIGFTGGPANNTGGWSEIIIDSFNAGAAWWLNNNALFRTDIATLGTLTFNAGTAIPTYGMCQNPANGRFYCATRTASLIRMNNDGSFPGAITLPAGSVPYCARYNPFDGLIYVPTYGGNSVVVINPATEAIVATKSGFDSPFDVVFTATKKFAVQHGLSGLKEIV